MQKYVETVVRKSSELQVLAEMDHFENFGRVSKITQENSMKRILKKKRNYILEPLATDP